MSHPTPISGPQLVPSSNAPPRDCVREYPTLSPDTVELVAFDWKGIPRYRLSVPVIENVEGWHEFLLKRCRKTFPRPLELLG
jgi:hypothetical protein